MGEKDKEKLEKLSKLQKIIEEETTAYRIATDIIQEQANLYKQIIQPATRSVEILQKAMMPFNTIDVEKITAALNPISEITKTLNDSNCFKLIESLNNSFEYSNYLSSIDILNKNIEIITSAINAINQNEINIAIENLNEIDNSIMQNSNISIAEMSAEINDEDYKKPVIDYKDLDIILKTISFVNDPVKSAELLNNALIIADHCVDYNFKILILQKIIEEAASLIAEGLITFFVFLVGFALKILLRDTIIYKQYLELKDSVKKYKDDN